MYTSNIPVGTTKRLIRPNLALLGLGVFHLRTWVSEERAVKGDKGELNENVPQTVPHFSPGVSPEK